MKFVEGGKKPDRVFIIHWEIVKYTILVLLCTYQKYAFVFMNFVEGEKKNRQGLNTTLGD